MDSFPYQTIFRVENAKGQGPYRSSTNIPSRIESHCGGTKFQSHPTPCKDIGIDRYINPLELCGFATLKDLHKWFSLCELSNLFALGFEIKQVKGLVSGIGKYQIIFVPQTTVEKIFDLSKDI